MHYIHPRFIAVLLQLGDALDMDNNRFHPLTEEFLGKMPKESAAHWKKHKAIRRLRITNEKISISADCKNQDELRLVRMECDTIQDILKNATFYWSVIKPKESKACLPTIDQINLLLNGNSISPDLVEAQFEIAQEKAFELLIGNNIYTDQHFVFLRELLQNAVDATKIQYYREYKRKCLGEKYVELGQKNKQSKEISEEVSPLAISNKVSPLDYPIVIELMIKKKIQNGNGDEIFENVTENIENSKEKNQECEYGVLVKIRDCGTGINKEDIKQISNVGTSYEVKKEEIENMPKWLQPTGTFGIGLQSVFLATKVLKAYTHSMESEPLDITFYPRQEGNRGYINVMPRKTDNSSDPFGSCFELFVPHNKKKLHKDNPETWDGEDPFKERYEESRNIRHSKELLKQMALYLGEIVGEPLFPIHLYVKDCQSKERCEEIYSDDFMKKMRNLNVYIGNREEVLKTNINDFDKSSITWAYNIDKSEDTKGPDINNNIYKLDCKNAKLYIWNQKYNTYARIGIDRILAMRDNLNAPDPEGFTEENDGIKIYYKGILTAITEFEEDANLIEYMDIKETLSREYLKLNRKGFSKKGYDYLEKVYHEIVKTARFALVEFDGNTVNNKIDENTSIGRIAKEIDDLSKNNEQEKLERLCLSSAALVYFAMVNEKSDVYSNEISKNKRNLWDALLKKINADIHIEKKSTLYKIPVYEEDNNFKLNTISIFDLINSGNKYMVLSEREAGKNTHRWKQKLLKVNFDNYQVIKAKVRRLRNENSLSERRKMIIELQYLMKKYKNKLDDEKGKSYLEKHKEDVILTWILNNIPTMAIFALEKKKSEKKEFRINILDVEICDSVYFDLQMKNLVLERIQDKSEKIQRCSSIVWTGFSGLSLEEIRDSIEFVKRGRLSKAGYEKMIFPLTSKELKDVLENCYSKKETCEKIAHLIKIAEIISQLNLNLNAKNGNNDIDNYKKVIHKIQSRLIKEDGSVDIKTVLRNIDINKLSEIDKKSLSDSLKVVKKGIEAIKEEEKDLGEMLYQKYGVKREKIIQMSSYDNIRNYVHIHGKLKPTHETIDLLYERYMYELAQIIIYRNYQEFIETESKNKPKKIQNILEELIL